MHILFALVNGGWGDWTEWGACQVSCGGADQSRARLCDSPHPKNHGDHCTVDGSKSYETQRCNENPCRKENTIIFTTTWRAIFKLKRHQR